MVILLVLAVAGIILGAVALTKKCDTAHKEGLFVGSSMSEFSSCAGTVVPIGTILPFYAMNGDKFDRTRIPDGWVICDGKTHGVPDLRNKYLMGSDADSNFTANVNGGKPFNLTSDNLPSHTHTYSDSKYTGNLTFPTNGGLGISVPNAATAAVEDGTTGSTGAGTSIPIPIGDYINNFPIVYIMYVGTETESPCTDKMMK